MVLDIFASLTSDDDHAQTDHMFTGKAGNMVAVTDVLDAVYCENRRLRVMLALASRFHNGAIYLIPCMRPTKAEYRVLVDAITDFGQSMPKTTKTRKLVDLLASSVYAY